MYEAEKLIAKSEWMQGEISRIYKVPLEKIKVVPPTSPNWLEDILEIYKSAIGGSTAK
jgi:hypothetical protein